MIVELRPECPEIALELEKTLTSIENVDECILAIQLSYREANTLFHLENIDRIIFAEYYIQIIQRNNSVCFLDYTQIFEYYIIHKKDIGDFEEGYL